MGVRPRQQQLTRSSTRRAARARRRSFSRQHRCAAQPLPEGSHMDMGCTHRCTRHVHVHAHVLVPEEVRATVLGLASGSRVQ